MIKLDNVSLVFQGGSVALSNISTNIKMNIGIGMQRPVKTNEWICTYTNVYVYAFI